MFKDGCVLNGYINEIIKDTLIIDASFPDGLIKKMIAGIITNIKITVQLAFGDNLN